MGFNKDGLTRAGGRAEARPALPPSTEGTSENTGRGPDQARVAGPASVAGQYLANYKMHLRMIKCHLHKV